MSGADMPRQLVGASPVGSGTDPGLTPVLGGPGLGSTSPPLPGGVVPRTGAVGVDFGVWGPFPGRWGYPPP